MIVVCGEALMDIFVGQPDGAHLPTEAVAGGSPFNVAIGVARLGSRSAFLSTLSEDAFGVRQVASRRPASRRITFVDARNDRR